MEARIYLARRAHLRKGEKSGQIVDGITRITNTAAIRSILMAVGKPIATTRGANADHAWADAPYDPAHFTPLAGIVLVPMALSSLVDATPIRALLHRHIYERCG